MIAEPEHDSDQTAVHRIQRFHEGLLQREGLDLIQVGPFLVARGVVGDPDFWLSIPTTSDPSGAGETWTQQLADASDAGATLRVLLLGPDYAEIDAAIAATGATVLRDEPLMLLSRGDWRMPDLNPEVRLTFLNTTSNLADILQKEWVTDIGFEPEVQGTYSLDRAKRSREGLRNATAILATLNHSAAGGGRVSDPIDGMAWINAVATAEAHRGNGVATAVTAALVGRAFELGADSVALAALRDNAARLYASLGFREISRQRTYRTPKVSA